MATVQLKRNNTLNGSVATSPASLEVGELAINYKTGYESLFAKNDTGGIIALNDWANIRSKPTSLPASDVYAWAKASVKPSYTYSDVGAAASSHSHSYLPLSGGTMSNTNLVSNLNANFLNGKTSAYFEYISQSSPNIDDVTVGGTNFKGYFSGKGYHSATGTFPTGLEAYSVMVNFPGNDYTGLQLASSSGATDIYVRSRYGGG